MKNKPYDYVIVFRQSGYRIVDRISQFMLLLSVVIFVFTAFVPFTRASPVLLGVVAFIVTWWIYCYRQQKKGIMPFFRLALVFAAWGWYLQPNGLFPALVYLLAAFLEGQVKFPQEVAFDPTEVVVNSFPKKHYQWSELANVVLKDNLLTIDFKNNKLVQKETDGSISAREEEEFNDFCRKWLNA